MKFCIQLSVWLLLAIAVSAAWGQRSSNDPAANEQAKQGDGFVDFALKRINRQNVDYGCQLDEARKITIDQTIKSIDSWAALVALVFLVLSFFMLLHQHRERDRHEFIASQFLAQYHNSWVDAQGRAEHAIRRYNELVDTTNSAAENAFRLQPPETERAQTATVKSAVGCDPKPQPPSSPALKSGVLPVENRNQGDRILQNREPQVDLIAQIKTLQQQLTASHEREKNLQRQLTKTQPQRQGEPTKSTNLSHS
jgi:hypothetical protein